MSCAFGLSSALRGQSMSVLESTIPPLKDQNQEKGGRGVHGTNSRRRRGAEKRVTVATRGKWRKRQLLELEQGGQRGISVVEPVAAVTSYATVVS